MLVCTGHHSISDKGMAPRGCLWILTDGDESNICPAKEVLHDRDARTIVDALGTACPIRELDIKGTVTDRDSVLFSIRMGA